MQPTHLSALLQQCFGEAVTAHPPETWQVETPEFRLLLLLSANQTWLRVLLPLVPASEVQSILDLLLQANFDQTHECRYALHEGVIWGVFQHPLASLQPIDLEGAIATLVNLQHQGFGQFYQQLIEQRLRSLVQVAQQQGQSLEQTLQTLERFYEEGVLGDLGQGADCREASLAAWRYQLERLWPELEGQASAD
jgi:hypothetical protein